MKDVFILGSGAMAQAMAVGLVKSGFKVVLICRQNSPHLAAVRALSGVEVGFYEEFDLEGRDVILAFKPYALGEVAPRLKGRANLLVSILARTSLDALKAAFTNGGAAHFVTAMPNLAARSGVSVTPFLAECEQGAKEASELLSGFGEAVRTQSQSEFEAAGVLAGCAPAFLGVVAQGLLLGAVRGGVSAVAAKRLTDGVFASFAALAKQGSESSFDTANFTQIVQQVCSPNGTTIEGVFELQKHGVSGAVMSAFAASLAKQKGGK